MLIRHAKLEDWDQVAAIELENFAPEEAATPEDMKNRLTYIADTFLVAEINQQVAGYIVGPAVNKRYLTDDLFHEVVPNPAQGGFIAITSLSVNPDFKGQGVGTALIAALKDLAVSQNRQGLNLTCHDYLIPYYEMNGFTDEGISESTHGGATWYNMVWEVPKNG
ncbi:GNAT family N-acetyltransferase [Streptococcus loxodontisalivarius]|uniref:Ribosomal protein S18 acetylase RimI-like enzyme n=1 Tax=Streptococcus loxodontisalivarius TaxID=1349415 RepID=A0ABS2PUH7_9STRE|nr:GNAT family N-acetyltransferase [Streptococcus loxodontisalivarius]MBM7643694.1 ribosomal protein S18 acetylase RimI-like enzyme [Streptococcus loxodontisalivarius]